MSRKARLVSPKNKEYFAKHKCENCAWTGESARRHLYDDIYYCPRCGDVVKEL